MLRIVDENNNVFEVWYAFRKINMSVKGDTRTSMQSNTLKGDLFKFMKKVINIHIKNGMNTIDIESFGENVEKIGNKMYMSEEGINIAMTGIYRLMTSTLTQRSFA